MFHADVFKRRTRQHSENTNRLNPIRRIPQWETSITQSRRNKNMQYD